MRFYGICTYPHGGYTLLGLLLSTACAFIATTYAVASCRFLVVEFTSDTGDFEEYFVHTNQQAAAAASERTAPLRFKAAVGLFKFLRPISGFDDWSEGMCTGYTETMLDWMAAENAFFETSRVFAVLGVLLSTVVFIWSMGMGCIGLNIIQIYLLRGVLLTGTLVSSMTFLFTRSAVCQTLFLERDCGMGEGGLVMIVGMVLWLIALVVSFVYLDLVPLSEEDLELGKGVASSPEEQAKIDSEVKRQKARRAAAAARAARGAGSSGGGAAASQQLRPSRSGAAVAATTDQTPARVSRSRTKNPSHMDTAATPKTARSHSADSAKKKTKRTKTRMANVMRVERSRTPDTMERSRTPSSFLSSKQQQQQSSSVSPSRRGAAGALAAVVAGVQQRQKMERERPLKKSRSMKRPTTANELARSRSTAPATAPTVAPPAASGAKQQQQQPGRQREREREHSFRSSSTSTSKTLAEAVAAGIRRGQRERSRTPNPPLKESQQEQEQPQEQARPVGAQQQRQQRQERDRSGQQQQQQRDRALLGARRQPLQRPRLGPRQHQQQKQRRKPPPEMITVDDVTANDSLEVYLSPAVTRGGGGNNMAAV